MSFLLFLLCLIFTLCKADNTDDCLKNSSLTQEDLKMYDSVDEVPEKVLCFSKCMSKKMGLLEEDGKIDVGKLELVAGVKEMTEEQIGQLKECAEEVDTVEECEDMKKLQNCFMERFM